MTRTHLLLVGAPRSGTTLMASMLGCHPEVAMLNEDRGLALTKIVGKKVVGNKLCIPAQIDYARKIDQRVISLADWRSGVLSRRLRGAGVEASPRPTIERYLALKNIKVIGLLRAPEHVVASIMLRGGQSEKVAIARWCRAVRVIDSLKQEESDKVLVTTYERLVSDTIEVLKSIAQFLELEYSALMLDGPGVNPFYQGREGVSTSSVEPNVTLKNRIQSDHSDVWEMYQRLANTN